MKKVYIKLRCLFPAILAGLFLVSCSGPSGKSTAYNLPPGHYPGNAQENFAPSLQPGGNASRNLALHRASWHSSSYDYNLTAQLITDGIRDTAMPWYLTAATSDKDPLDKRVREALTDDNPVTTVNIQGKEVWVQIGLPGRKKQPTVDGILIKAPLRGIYQGQKGNWQCHAFGSDDGKQWVSLGDKKGYGTLADTVVFPLGGIFQPYLAFKNKVNYKYYRVYLKSPVLQQWNIGEFILYHNNKPMDIKTSLHFTSAWMSEGKGREWVYTDLGAVSEIDSLILYWIRPAKAGKLQISDDAKSWKDITPLPSSGFRRMHYIPDTPLQGRYVRLLLIQPANGKHYILSEMQVYGKGGLTAVPKYAPGLTRDGRLYLSGGKWKLQRSSQVRAGGAILSGATYDDAAWLPATVPGTELVSYLNVGAIPDPNYGDNQLMISESFFLSDFWYRNEFEVPASLHGKHLWLNFDGINWKAEVFLNGKHIGPINGAFIRGKFDVSRYLIPGKKNILAVKVKCNAHPGGMKEKTYESPGLNGGVLGADNPTFHATVGWDWIPTIRGRDAGIWNDVYISSTGPVILKNPYVTSVLPLPDTSSADITVTVTLENTSGKTVAGSLHGMFGDIRFEEPVSLEGGEHKTITLTPGDHPALHLQNPRLWWPVGYGQPNLYDVKLSFITKDHTVSDTKTFRTGIRQMAYSEKGGVLRIWVNGRRFTGRGGNWGFPESMLRYRKREYNIAVRYHRDMHFTMIRNWVGMTGDDEFWDACDKYGILVWQDFWLANPWDGPDPDDNLMFLDNARDFVLRIRNHPSIGLYCGRNEGYPPKMLDEGLRDIISHYHPEIHYIPNSADDVVSGHGPYRAMPIRYYFSERATAMLHSEMGMPNLMTLESLQETIPDSGLWPQGRLWGIHDFCAAGAQSARSFNTLVDKKYGGANNVKDWITLAQFVNYDGYRAMFEAQSRHRMGLLLWMSHSAWPSLVWQTYDYYFEPTAAYFGCKKASEPLHIQWNALTDSVEAVNYSGRTATGLKAHIEILNMDGKQQWENEVAFDLPEDSTLRCAAMHYPESLTPVHFIRLEMKRNNKIISRNFYLHGTREGDFTAIRQLPKVSLQTATQTRRDGDTWILTTELTNTSSSPALMVRLKVVRNKSRDRILPVLYSDNYIALMPGETRTIRMELAGADTRGEEPEVKIEGFNVSNK